MDENSQQAIRYWTLAQPVVSAYFTSIHFYENDRVSLFDLSKDLSEQNDLAKQMPGETKILTDRLNKYLVDVKAQMPTKNTEYDPAKPIAPRKGGKGGDKNDKGARK